MVKQTTNTGQEQLLKEITSLLSKARIPYMITGSVSVIFYGRPRASHDIDFIIEARKRDIEKVIQAFASLHHNEFIVDPLMIKDAIENKRQFNILHLPTMLKMDFWLLTNTQFDKERFKRRKKIRLFNQPMVFASPEDTILIKLLWHVESRIEKHLVDAAFVYQIQERKLDKSYLANWSQKHKTEKLLKGLATIDLEQYY